MKFIGFPSIESFHNAVKAVSAYPHLAPTPVKYRGKVKLHGTNAGIRLADGEVRAQSRTQLISVGNDNAGFAAWVESHKAYWLGVWKANVGVNGEAPSITVFGEFCGPGIMKGTAINNIPTKVFAIFAVHVGESAEEGAVITNPDVIAVLLGNRPSDVHVLPWEGEEFTVNFADRESLEKTVASLNTIIQNIEPSDPWVKKTFGVDGIAEGIVYVPGAGNVVSRKEYSDLCFKAKGEKHKVVKTKNAVQIDPEVAKSVGEFVKLFATEARFEQGLEAVGGATEIKNIGPFIKWVAQDILKESVDELEASDLEWSDVEKSIQTTARNFYLVKNKAL